MVGQVGSARRFRAELTLFSQDLVCSYATSSPDDSHIRLFTKSARGVAGDSRLHWRAGLTPNTVCSSHARSEIGARGYRVSLLFYFFGFWKCRLYFLCELFFKVKGFHRISYLFYVLIRFVFGGLASQFVECESAGVHDSTVF